jgi:hypothetical protein
MPEAAYAATRIAFHGGEAGSLIQAHHSGSDAWLTVNDFLQPGRTETGPEIVVFFHRSLRGREQLLALAQQLEHAAAALLEDYSRRAERSEAEVVGG